MRIQFASDLHLEAWPKTTFDETLEPAAPVLALCGDIAALDNPNLRAFLEWCSERWKTILWIPGKMEGGSSGAGAMRTLAAPYKNITVFHHDMMMSEDGFIVIGLTYAMYPLDGTQVWSERRRAWEHPEPSPHPPKEMIAAWKAERKWLAQTLATINKPVIVLSHFPPAPWLSQEGIVGDPKDYTRSAEEEKMLESSIVAWVCGHTHKTVDFKKLWVDAVGDEHQLLLVSNPRGYALQNFEYRTEAVLALVNNL
jgi:hypothetical protein